jgi:hypothetical protein
MTEICVKNVGSGVLLGVVVLLVALGLMSCAVTLSPAARVRREAAARLGACLGMPRPRAPLVDVQKCRQESQEFCRRHGLEAACGVDGLW